MSGSLLAGGNRMCIWLWKFEVVGSKKQGLTNRISGVKDRDI